MFVYDLIKVPDGQLENCRKIQCPLLTEYLGNVICGARFSVQNGNSPIGDLVKASEAGCYTAKNIYEQKIEEMRKE